MKTRLWVMVANAASVSTRATRSRRVLKRAARFLFQGRLPALILVSEAADFLVRDLVDTDVWQVVQFGELGAPESGVAMLARKDRCRLDNPRLEPGSREGEGIRARPILVADLSVWAGGRWRQVGPVASIHTPPARAAAGQHAYMTSLRNLDDVVLAGGDFNYSRRLISAWLSRSVRAVGVLALTARRHIVGGVVHLGRVRRRNIGSDHPSVLVPVVITFDKE